MNNLRVSSLQWYFGIFFSVMGALMLVAPHQFIPSSVTTFQHELKVWGTISILVGLGLFYLSVFKLSFIQELSIFLISGTFAFFLAEQFAGMHKWIESLNYLIFGCSLAGAGVLRKVWQKYLPDRKSELLVLVIGINTIFSGILMFMLGGDILDEGVNYSGFYLKQYGIIFILAGAILLYFHIYKSKRNFSSKVLWGVHIIIALLFFGFAINIALSFHIWNYIIFYGGFGGALLLLPLASSDAQETPVSSRTKLALILSATMAIPLIITVTLICDREEHSVQSQSIIDQQGRSVLLARSISDYMRVYQSSLLTLARDPDINKANSETLQEQLEIFGNIFPDKVHCVFYDKNGNMLASNDSSFHWPKLNQTNFLDKQHDFDGVDMDILSPPKYPQKAVCFTAPIHDRNMNYSGLVGIVMDTEIISNFIIHRIRGMIPRVIYLTDEQGNSFISPVFTSSNVSLAPTIHPVIQATLHKNFDRGGFSYSMSSGTHIVGYSRVPGLPWYVTIEQSLPDSLTSVYQERNLAFLILLFTLMITVLLGILLARWLAFPLGRLAYAVTELSQGNADAPLPKSNFAEIQNLAGVFGDMRNKLIMKTQQQIKTENELLKAKEDLEVLVVERTYELRNANQQLQVELEERKRTEQSLMISESREKARREEVEAIMNAVPGIILIAHDPQCLKITGNRATYELLRLKEDLNVSLTAVDSEKPHTFRVLLNGIEVPVSELPVQKAARGIPVRDIEEDILFDDGTYRRIYGHATPLLDESGKPRGAVAAFIDITDRMQTEQALRKSESSLARAQEIANMGSWEWDLVSNCVTWSDQMYIIYGVERADFTPSFEKTLEMFYPEDRYTAKNLFEEAISDKSPLRFEHRLIVPTGDIKNIQVQAEVISDTYGKSIRIVGVSMDITSRKKAEKELHRIEWLLQKPIIVPSLSTHGIQPPYGDVTELNNERLLLDMVGETVLKEIVGDYLDLLETSAAVMEKNGDYALAVFSSSWCKFMDQSSRHLCGDGSNHEAIQSGKWHCHESCWKDAALPSIQKNEPVDIACKGGIRMHAIPIEAGGDVVGSINFGYGDPPKDHQELQKLADLYEVDVNDLIKHSSRYESRPPFIIEIAKKRLATSAKLIGEMIERRRAEKRLQELNVDLEQRITERTSLLAAANKELEAFSYSVSHDLRAPLRSINGFSAALEEDFSKELPPPAIDYLNRIRGATKRMGFLIDDLLNFSRLSRVEMHNNSIDLSMLARSIRDEIIQSDPERKVEWNIEEGMKALGDNQLIRVVLMNLLSNAWKFTSKTTNARIEFSSLKMEQNQLAFYVKDNGAGFNMNYYDKLFTPFQRLHSTSEFEGTGIGLAIVQRIIFRHKGQIWAQSEIGKGSTFFFTVPG